MRRAALGEAATTASSRPAPISALAWSGVRTAAALSRCAVLPLRCCCPAGPLRGCRVAGGEAAARVGRIIHGAVRGHGLDEGAPGLQPAAQPGVGDVCLRQEHAALVLGPDVDESRAGLLPGGGRGRRRLRRIPGTAGRGSDRGDEEAAGKPAAEGGAPLGGFGLQRLHCGHAADHQPGVGTGAEGVEGHIQGVLVAGEFEIDERQQQGFGADVAQGCDKLAPRGPGCGPRGPGRRPAPSRCGRCDDASGLGKFRALCRPMN